PIGWISSLDENGLVNLAPYSFFNAFGTDPHVVGFSSEGRKDSLRNIEKSGEFVCNYVAFDLREVMNKTSASVGPEVSEMSYAGIESAPSRLVKPPRVAKAAAALECRYMQTVPLVGAGGAPATYFLVLGEVVGIYIDDRFVRNGRFDAAAAQPIARAGYHDYMMGDRLFELKRPTKG
ncbi:MAG: flavin reductase family protein, partial [Rhizobiales bacterium]|nr:flavin reductase family protein [Hyphomicrobiales bacterium]